jgi:flagellar protein FliS
MLVELCDVGIRRDLVVMRKLINIATDLRDGFVGAADQLAKSKAEQTTVRKSA